MSWLKNHMRHFVLPGIHTLARNQGRNLGAGNFVPQGHGITEHDIKPRDKAIRPSQKCKYVEAGSLYAMVSSVLSKGNPTREIALGLCRQIGRGNDAEFIYEVDSKGRVKSLGEHYDGVEGSDVLHSMLCNSMRRLKRKMRKRQTLLLPGRDVWCWEVMSRKLSVESTYDSRVSRAVANNRLALKVCMNEWQIQDWNDVLFFDTGFAGSIPKAIGQAADLDKINMALLSQNGEGKDQLFRTHTGSRAKALAFEYLAKYRRRGTTRGSLPYQELADLEEFIKAALLTIWLWYHISPQRLPSYRDKKLPKAKKNKSGGLSISSAAGGLWTTTNDFWLTNSGTTTSAVTPLTTTGNWDTNIAFASSASTTGWDTGASTIQAMQTLDQLWGAGVSGELLLDKTPPPPHMLQKLQDEVAKEIDKQVMQSVIDPAKSITDPAKVPLGKVPPSLAFEPIPTKATKIKPYVLNPDTFTLHDPKTGVNIEVQEDVKAVLSGKKQPSQEGFELGQYPGPPIVNEQMLKAAAGMDPKDPGVPDIELKVKIEPGNGGANPIMKQTTLTTPDGKKKVYKTPLTG